MKWLDAPTLGNKIREYCRTNNRAGLKNLAEKFREFALWILKQPFAHGDLKHDNLLVKPDGSMVMIDYDGMFIPAFAGQTTNELGGKSYQHPKRTAKTFDRHLDDFSILIIYTSLLALSEWPGLYDKYYNGQNIIFSRHDFEDIVNSKLLGELNNITELDEFLSVVEKSLQIEKIKIKNIFEILYDDISKYKFAINLHILNLDFQKHFQSIKNLVGDRYDSMNINKFIDSQEEIFKNKLEVLQSELMRIRCIEDERYNPLTKKWWKGLNKKWKNIFLKQYYRKVPDSYVFTKQFADFLFNLKEIDLSENEIQDIKPLSYFKNLTKLDLWNNRIADLTPLSNLKNLTVLDLRDNEIIDLFPFGNSGDTDPLIR
jgi:hypothetical protein